MQGILPESRIPGNACRPARFRVGSLHSLGPANRLCNQRMHARAAKRAFLFLAKRHHPDQGGSHHDFVHVKDAYDRATAAWGRVSA